MLWGPNIEEIGHEVLGKYATGVPCSDNIRISDPGDHLHSYYTPSYQCSPMMHRLSRPMECQTEPLTKTTAGWMSSSAQRHTCQVIVVLIRLNWEETDLPSTTVCIESWPIAPWIGILNTTTGITIDICIAVGGQSCAICDQRNRNYQSSPLLCYCSQKSLPRLRTRRRHGTPYNVRHLGERTLKT